MAGVEAVLIAAYSRPFTGEISVKPDLLKQALPAGPRRESLPLGMSVMGRKPTSSERATSSA
jgi:hypothetical protein